MRYSEVKDMINEIGRFALDKWNAEQWEVAEYLVDEGCDPDDVAKCVDDGEYTVYEDTEEYIEETLSNCGISIPQWVVIDYDTTWDYSLYHDYNLYKLDDGRILDAYGL